MVKGRAAKRKLQTGGKKMTFFLANFEADGPDWTWDQSVSEQEDAGRAGATSAFQRAVIWKLRPVPAPPNPTKYPAIFQLIRSFCATDASRGPDQQRPVLHQYPW